MSRRPPAVAAGTPDHSPDSAGRRCPPRRTGASPHLPVRPGERRRSVAPLRCGGWHGWWPNVQGHGVERARWSCTAGHQPWHRAQLCGARGGAQYRRSAGDVHEHAARAGALRERRRSVAPCLQGARGAHSGGTAGREGRDRRVPQRAAGGSGWRTHRGRASQRSGRRWLGWLRKARSGGSGLHGLSAPSATTCPVTASHRPETGWRQRATSRRRPPAATLRC